MNKDAPSLPIEIVDHIFDVAIHRAAFEPSTLAKYSLISRTVRRKARAQLYRSVRLDRMCIGAFIEAVERDRRTCLLDDDDVQSHTLVKNVAFVASCSSSAYDNHSDEHEHVKMSDVLRCLSLVRCSLEGLCIDMACSQVACGWYADLENAERRALTLPKLARLSCRCPKGYLPTCTRKLLDLFQLGQSPLLVELLLYWTGPGSSFDAPDNAESLTKTLQSCPNVCRLSIVEARYTNDVTHVTYNDDDEADVPVERICDEKEARGDEDNRDQLTTLRRQLVHSHEMWVKSTSANGAVFRTPSLHGDKRKLDADVLLRASYDGVLASQAQADSDAPPTAVSESIARAARRIDQRKNTLRAHMASINIPSSLVDAFPSTLETSVVDVKGKTHPQLRQPIVDAASADSSVVGDTTYHSCHDDGWHALISILQSPTRPPLAP